MNTSGDRAAASFLLLFAGFVIVQARGLTYWTGTAPGPGFLPFWLGVLLACGSLAVIVGRAAATVAGGAEALPNRWPDRAGAKRLCAVVGITAAAAALSLAIGFVLATGLFMLATLAYLRPGHARSTWTIGLLTPPVVWLLFAKWLAVPLPPGLLGF